MIGSSVDQLVDDARRQAVMAKARVIAIWAGVAAGRQQSRDGINPVQPFHRREPELSQWFTDGLEIWRRNVGQQDRRDGHQAAGGSFVTLSQPREE
ncbi:hypothetical protein [Telmatospirillum sp.]|uniref:hypothetical protein n=1 Tax=Telmatospirillum sp. TaxID=2079197 RepID=UPI00284B48CE|nr:hypothetical protein [Telmatospirillum sp.]MDR3438971.1 hypothetical protein [Telmatospirillum sp.]